MKILGIDYGRKKIGLAFATTVLAEAYGVIRVEGVEEAIAKIKNVVEKEKVEKIVIGVSEGAMAKETRGFAKTLGGRVGKIVVLHDETFSTKEARRLAAQAQVGEMKKREFEDAFAAAVMLQDYLNYKV